MGDTFPKELAGRANGALNLLHIGAAFLVQGGIGFIVDHWPADPAGHHPAHAYAAAFGLNLAAQALAFGWFWLAPRLQGSCALPAPAGTLQETGR